MSTTLFRRPPRRPGPELPAGEVALQEPPTLPESATAGISGLLFMLPMAAGGAATMLIFVGPGASSGIGYLAAGLMAVSMLGMSAGAAATASASWPASGGITCGISANSAAGCVPSPASSGGR